MMQSPGLVYVCSWSRVGDARISLYKRHARLFRRLCFHSWIHGRPFRHRSSVGNVRPCSSVPRVQHPLPHIHHRLCCGAEPAAADRLPAAGGRRRCVSIDHWFGDSGGHGSQGETGWHYSYLGYGPSPRAGDWAGGRRFPSRSGGLALGVLGDCYRGMFVPSPGDALSGTSQC
jgi:hypothetical protein